MGAEAQGGRSFGTLVRYYRVQAGLTQDELAERARLSRRSISAIESGVAHLPRRDTLDLLATALDLAPEDRSHFLETGRHRTPPGSSLQMVTPAGTTSFIGRATEMALLDRHVAREGPPLLVLAGEPGIGKSRLLRAAIPRAVGAGLRVPEAGCQQRGGQMPYAPFLAAIQHYLQSQSPGQLRKDLRGCAWLVRLLPELAAGPIDPLPAWSVPPEHERRLMFAAVTRLLTNIAGPTGTLLVLDDLQWAGADALDLLVALGHNAAEIPLRLIVAYRDTEVSPDSPLAATLAELGQAQLTSRTQLGPLSPAEAERLLDALLAGTTTEAAQRAQVLKRAGGVPFFLVSCAAGLRQEAGRANHAAVPWDVTQSVRQRVIALSAVAQQVLGVIAVIGRTAPFGLVQAVAMQPEHDVLAALEVACHAHLLTEEGNAVYSFTHDVIREVVAANLGGARRMLLHRDIAHALDARPGPPPVVELAYHYDRAGDAAQAARWQERAGDEAASGHANAAALEHYTMARQHLATGADTAALSHLDEKMGDLHFLMGAYASAGEDFARARRVAHQPLQRANLWHKEGLSYRWRGEFAHALAAFDAAEAEGEDSMARVLPGILQATLELSRGNVYLWGLGKYATADVAVRRAITLLSEESSSTEVDSALARAYALLGQIAARAGDNRQAEAFCRNALDLQERQGDQASLALYWNELGLVLYNQDKLTQAEQCHRRALAIGDQIGYQLPVAVVWHSLGEIARSRGDLRQAEDCALNGRSLSERIGHWAGVFRAWEDLGWVELLRGNLAQAQTHFQCSLAMQEGRQTAESSALLGLGLVALECGDLSVAANRFRAARRLGCQNGRRLLEASGMIGQARTRLRAGRLRAATMLLEREQALAAMCGWEEPLVDAALLQVELHLRCGALCIAQQAAEAALHLIMKEGRRYDEAVIQRLLGQCALAQGRRNTAEDHLHAALTLQKDLGADLEAARSRMALAQALQCGTEARMLLTEARTQFAASGAAIDLAQADQLAAEWQVS